MLKPKILVISNYTDFHSVRPEAEIFLSLHRRGYEVTIMTFGGSVYAEKFAEAGLKIIDHHPTRKHERESILKIRTELKEGKYDILHLYNNKSIINGLIAAKNLPVTTIGYRGSTLNFEWYNPFNYIKHLSPSLDYVICNSIGVANKYKAHPFFKSEKAVVINKGHDTKWYSDIIPVDLREKYNIDKTAPIFILVATDRTMKGVKYLCHAVNLLPPKKEFRLLLIGGGMDNPKYKDILSKGPHQDKVITQSHNPEALQYVAGADVFVLPSIKGESITKAALEAMSLGKCPIITDIPGNTELVKLSVNGLVAKKENAKSLAHAMQTVIDNPELITQYGDASKERIANALSHHQTVDGYEALYEKIATNA